MLRLYVQHKQILLKQYYKAWYFFFNLFQHRTFAHLMDGVKQDWMTVACLLEDTLHHIKMQLPNIERVFLRSDNAGCYHCGNLWLAIPGISMRTGKYFTIHVCIFMWINKWINKLTMNLIQSRCFHCPLWLQRSTEWKVILWR